MLISKKTLGLEIGNDFTKGALGSFCFIFIQKVTLAKLKI
jgi:hypothetical protein